MVQPNEFVICRQGAVNSAEPFCSGLRRVGVDLTRPYGAADSTQHQQRPDFVIFSPAFEDCQFVESNTWSATRQLGRPKFLGHG